jgi:aryl-alcohol dehydrogenase
MQVEAAVCYEKHAPFQIKKLEMKDPGPGNVLVKLVASGLCHTDISARDGAVPAATPGVFGHEGCGIVEAVGADVTKVAEGDHVVLTFAFCGACDPCASGHPAYCDQCVPLNFTDARSGGPGTFYEGDKEIHGHFFGQSSFASYAIAEPNNVVKVRKDAPLELLGVLGCGIQTGAGTVMNVLKARPGDSFVVLGVGPVGLASILGARVCGCTTIIAVDILESRLQMAKDLGATHTINASSASGLVEQIHKIVPHGVNFALDTSGWAQNCKAGLNALSTSGKLAFLGVPRNDKPIEADMFQMLLKGQSMMGVVQGDSVPQIFIPLMIDLYMSGMFPFDRMITKYKFHQINEAIEDQKNGKVAKVVLTFP